jgi:hypothetical protein
MERDRRGSAGTAAGFTGSVDNPISVVDLGVSLFSCFDHNCRLKLHPRGLVGRLCCCGVEAYDVPDVCEGDRRIPLICSCGDATDKLGSSEGTLLPLRFKLD